MASVQMQTVCGIFNEGLCLSQQISHRDKLGFDVGVLFQRRCRYVNQPTGVGLIIIYGLCAHLRRVHEGLRMRHAVVVCVKGLPLIWLRRELGEFTNLPSQAFRVLRQTGLTITCARKLGLTVTPRLPKPVEPCRVNAAITIE